jgi:glutathione synthase/RimK-type ligase-like ATP-grasp enzyme
VFNLCRSYRYQRVGYYVSLLAEARGHRAIPDVATIQDLRYGSLTRAIADDLDDLIQRTLRTRESREFELNIYFGQTYSHRYSALGNRLYNLFQAPLLRVSFVRGGRKWIVQQVSPLPLTEIPTAERARVLEFARKYFSRKRFNKPRLQQYNYDLAILVNPDEPDPPSNSLALQKFEHAAEKLGFYTERIGPQAGGRLAEFDALFIRETTSVNHHTYRFSRLAYAEGLVVIDDPWSILRCANKVYLAELLGRARIPTPKTFILAKGADNTPPPELPFPCVLKQPDSAFSRGVAKAQDPEEFRVAIARLFEGSDLVIAQEFSPTPFDWRIGVLDRRPLFACKYYMARGHWQIYNWNGTVSDSAGDTEALAMADVPREVLETALKAAALVGDGFYGVDLKQVDGRVMVIEVNDNPSVDAGCEDLVLGDQLYERVMRCFLDRIEAARRPVP